MRFYSAESESAAVPGHHSTLTYHLTRTPQRSSVVLTTTAAVNIRSRYVSINILIRLLFLVCLLFLFCLPFLIRRLLL